MNKQKYLMLIMLVALLSGCAASPLDIIMPTRQGVVTSNYLGHLNYEQPLNRLYHSLADTKAERELIKIRRLELDGLRLAAGGETAIIEQAASAVSNGVWGWIDRSSRSHGPDDPQAGYKSQDRNRRADEP